MKIFPIINVLFGFWPFYVACQLKITVYRENKNITIPCPPFLTGNTSLGSVVQWFGPYNQVISNEFVNQTDGSLSVTINQRNAGWYTCVLTTGTDKPKMVAKYDAQVDIFIVTFDNLYEKAG